MSVFKSVQTYKKILSQLQANGVSDPILAADFKAVDFTLITSDNSNFEIVVGVSNNSIYDKPDPNSPITPDNQYTEDIAYVDLGNGATYNDAYTSPNPYNPSTKETPGTQAVSKQFRFNTNNAQWVYIRVQNYVAGTIESVNIALSDNG